MSIKHMVMTREELASALRAMDDVLDEVEDYLSDYEDVIDGEDGRQLPNSAMRLLIQVRAVRAKARGEQP